MSYDIFAAKPNLPVDADSHTALLVQHAADCMSADPSKETEAKRKFKALFASGPAPFAHRGLMQELGLTELAPNAIQILPLGSVILQFKFTLSKKYVSRDDAAFFPNDNPLRKEFVFKVPMVAPATWKGSLRASAVEKLVSSSESNERKLESRLALVDIFGDEKSSDEDPTDGGEGDVNKLEGFLDRHLRATAKEFRARRQERFRLRGLRSDELHQRGRLMFFPSWFSQTRLDVLNPRKRDTRAGSVPITVESVPARADSIFTLIYLPFDLLGQPSEMGAAQGRDWKLIGEAIAYMFQFAGFGAKKTSGCGRARFIQEVRFECSTPGFNSPISNHDAQGELRRIAVGELATASEAFAGAQG